jgi:hypothetical protein
MKKAHPLPSDPSELRRYIDEQNELAAQAAQRLKNIEAERQAQEEENRRLAKAEQERKERQAIIDRYVAHILAPVYTLERVRYLSENACRPKRPLPKPTPVADPTKLDPPYENAA